jgi:hypothetical protein
VAWTNCLISLGILFDSFLLSLLPPGLLCSHSPPLLLLLLLLLQSMLKLMPQFVVTKH